MKIAGCGLDAMIEYLCYCRFEMVDLEMEEKKPVENVFNWFFRIIERAGGYPRPRGYKSFEEKEIEREKAIVEERERLAKEARELIQRKFQAEQDAEFWEMMSDPDGEAYRKCLDTLPDSIKVRRFKGGLMFETAMRKAFNEINEPTL